MLLVRTASITLGEKPVMAIPRAVPLAGGCSTSSATISRMEIPTATEYTITAAKIEEWGMREHNEPEKRPTRCPPITRLGLAVIFLGMVKTIKAVAPIEAITTACSADSSRNTISTTTVARKL